MRFEIDLIDAKGNKSTWSATKQVIQKYMQVGFIYNSNFNGRATLFHPDLFRGKKSTQIKQVGRR